MSASTGQGGGERVPARPAAPARGRAGDPNGRSYSNSAPPFNVVLIGFMGTGKTAVGRRIAERLGLTFVDTDAIIETRAGRTIARIIAEDGESVFRRLEADAVAEAGASQGAVIATGGGVPLRSDNMRHLRRRGVIVALTASPRAILTRVGGGAERPLLGADPESAVPRLLAERDAAYRDADLLVDTSEASADEVADRVVAFVAARSAARTARAAESPAPRQVRVELGERGYDVRIGGALLPRLPDLLRDAGVTGRLALLTHPRLDARYGRPLAETLRGAGRDVVTVTVPPSESSKSLRVASRVYDALVDAQLDRGAALLTLGGGVAGDLGGFVAATFLRGIRWVALPTTLLAQVDAAIGGKTAVDHPRGKNLIGAVHQPALVVADVETLASLPRRELRSGMAEVIKTGVIGARDLFEFLEGNLRRVLARRPAALVHTIERCAAYKARIVAADERETGERIVLNYGHTIGHAIEAAAGYRGLRHGEAIAVGMTLEARLAVRLGLCKPGLLERQTALLEQTGLPVRLAGLGAARPGGAAAILGAMTHDKKARAGRLRFVLPVEIGRTAVRDDVPSALLEEVLADG
ncbi:MAG TPA: 3-dehydroquinate synthase [bacterium]|nr:3-dehydroquinate synthase [bacterium]